MDTATVAEHLAGAIRFETVSVREGASEGAAFRGLRRYLRRTYPLAHDRLGCEEVGQSSLLYEWSGTDRARAPIVLMAHLDVVPILPGSESSWTHPPFSGAIDGGFAYGRGALDDKSAVIAILEAVEKLLGDNHRPVRTIYLAFGGDEELGGERGALPDPSWRLGAGGGRAGPNDHRRPCGDGAAVGKAPLIVPFLTGPTDSRHWSAGGARNVFRFTPFPYEQDWMARAHGTDERISVQGLASGVSFYAQLILNSERI